MAFLNPLILLALPFAAVPFLLHLMRRRRAPRRAFTYLRFLQEAHRQRFLSFRVREVILLMLRTAIVVLVILALAGPTLPPESRHLFRTLMTFGTPSREILVLVDTSLSLSAADDRGVRLERAVDLAREMTGSARATDRVRVLTTGDLMSDAPIAPVAGQAMPAYLNAIAEATGSYDALALLERAADALESPDTGVVMVIGDNQESVWRPTAAVELPRDSGIRQTQTVLVDVAAGAPRNLWFDRVTAPALPPLAGEPLSLSMQVSALGTGRTEEATVRAFRSDGELLDSRSVSLPAPMAATDTVAAPVVLNLLASASGGEAELAGWVDLTVGGGDSTGDALRGDDSFAYRIPVLRDLRVLVAAPDEDTWTPFVLNLALSMDLPEDSEVVPLRAETVGFGRLSGHALHDYTAVVLAGLPEDPAALGALNTYVRDGGGLLWVNPPVGSGSVTEARAPRPRSGWSAFWTPAAWAASPGDLSALLNLSLGREWRSADGAAITAANWAHPVLADLRDFGLPAFETARFWRGVDGSGFDEVLLMAGPRTILGEKVYGEGRVLVLLAGLGRTDSDLAVTPIFLPLMQQAVKYLAAHDGVPVIDRSDPAESDLRPLSAAARQQMRQAFPVEFARPETARRLAAQGTPGYNLTSPLLLLIILLALLELTAANLGR